MFRFYSGFVGCSLQTKRVAREEGTLEGESEYNLAFLLFDSEASALEAQGLLSGTKFDYHNQDAPILKVQLAKKNLGLSSAYWANESPRVNTAGVTMPGSMQGAMGAVDPYTGAVSYHTAAAAPLYGASAFGTSSEPRKKRKPMGEIPPSTTLFVTNLGTLIDDETLRACFRNQEGFVDLFVSERNGRRFAFVEFQSESNATTASTRMNGMQMISNDPESGLKISYSSTPFRPPKSARA